MTENSEHCVNAVANVVSEHHLLSIKKEMRGLWVSVCGLQGEEFLLFNTTCSLPYEPGQDVMLLSRIL